MKTLLSSLAAIAVAMSANAAIVTHSSFQAIESYQGGVAEGVVYSGIPGPYASFAAGASLGAAHYQSAMTNDVEYLSSFRFVGGVVTANTTLSFTFWDDAGVTAISSFETTFSQAGNYIWTITIDPAGDAIAAGKNGWLEVLGVGGATGKWFLSTSLPTIGSQDDVTGSGHRHAFEMTTVATPAPGAIALLGLAGLIGRRRR